MIIIIATDFLTLRGGNAPERWQCKPGIFDENTVVFLSLPTCPFACNCKVEQGAMQWRQSVHRHSPCSSLHATYLGTALQVLKSITSSFQAQRGPCVKVKTNHPSISRYSSSPCRPLFCHPKGEREKKMSPHFPWKSGLQLRLLISAPHEPDSAPQLKARACPGNGPLYNDVGLSLGLCINMKHAKSPETLHQHVSKGTPSHSGSAWLAANETTSTSLCSGG